MLGSFKKSIQKEEKEMSMISRKSPYYKDSFSIGKKIKKSDIIMLDLTLDLNLKIIEKY